MFHHSIYTWEEAVMAHFKELSRHMHGRIGDNHTHKILRRQLAGSLTESQIGYPLNIQQKF
jgi:hypothetical protein